jgi:GNAT superfamily N-acetyltransferase
VSGDDLRVREATDEDLPQILALLQSSLGWVPDEQYAAFYRWKHHQNPFGRSPAWVAVDGDRVVGLRVWLRWRFTDGARAWDAVRAVDTATHPEYQGRGIFRRLTSSSLEELRAQGVAHVFNTPNEQSKPGYLKMGWKEVGRLPVAVRFRSPLTAGTAVRARVPAQKWSVSSDAGSPALAVLVDESEVAELVAGMPSTGIRTDLNLAVLRWRYGFEPLHYRGLRMSDGGGVGLFRLRRRGPALECVVGHVLAPDGTSRRRLLSRIAKVSGADQVLQITDRPYLAGGFLPLPGGGPALTWRALTDVRMPPLADWGLTMGDVELF